MIALIIENCNINESVEFKNNMLKCPRAPPLGALLVLLIGIVFMNMCFVKNSKTDKQLNEISANIRFGGWYDELSPFKHSREYASRPEDLLRSQFRKGITSLNLV